MRSLLLLGALLVGCSSPTGATGTSLVSHPDVKTVFTIVFENEDGASVIAPSNAFFTKLANEQAQAARYVSSTHPSCPNYIVMTSGATQGVITDDDPGANVQVQGTDNLADQLDAAHVPWRAYMESMGEPCKMVSTHDYSAHHDPFLYYATMADDPARCADRVVDFDASFAADLASNAYRFMWITPNMCNDLHDCSAEIADAWLEKTVGQIMASDAYKNGGAIFVLFDEGTTRWFGASASLATIVASPHLAQAGYVSETPFDHRSYLATVEDIFEMPRLPTTATVDSMGEFFTTRSP